MANLNDSFPLMRIARLYAEGDYETVLLWSDYFRMDRVSRQGLATGRLELLAFKLTLLYDRIGGAAYDALMRRLQVHANARWGYPRHGFPNVVPA